MKMMRITGHHMIDVFFNNYASEVRADFICKAFKSDVIYLTKLLFTKVSAIFMSSGVKSHVIIDTSLPCTSISNS